MSNNDSEIIDFGLELNNFNFINLSLNGSSLVPKYFEENFKPSFENQGSLKHIFHGKLKYALIPLFKTESNISLYKEKWLCNLMNTINSQQYLQSLIKTWETSILYFDYQKYNPSLKTQKNMVLSKSELMVFDYLFKDSTKFLKYYIMNPFNNTHVPFLKNKSNEITSNSLQQSLKLDSSSNNTELNETSPHKIFKNISLYEELFFLIKHNNETNKIISTNKEITDNIKRCTKRKLKNDNIQIEIKINTSKKNLLNILLTFYSDILIFNKYKQYYTYIILTENDETKVPGFILYSDLNTLIKIRFEYFLETIRRLIKYWTDGEFKQNLIKYFYAYRNFKLLSEQQWLSIEKKIISYCKFNSLIYPKHLKN